MRVSNRNRDILSAGFQGVFKLILIRIDKNRSGNGIESFTELGVRIIAGKKTAVLAIIARVSKNKIGRVW